MNTPAVPTEYLNIHLVGGAVRDMLLGLEPNDRDWVIVGADALDIEKLVRIEGFEKVGAHFPVFLHPRVNEEYALARTERKIGDGYHGFEVVYDKFVTIEEDLARRDFTINAMSYPAGPHKFDPSKFDASLVIDPFGGKQDLQDKVLRHTSSAFSEDPLRVIRLARFAAKLEDFTIAPETMQLAKEMVRSGQLNQLPKERFTAEISKVLRTIVPHRVGVFFDVLNQLDCQDYVTFFRSWDLIKARSCASRSPAGMFGDLHGVEVLAIVCSNDNEWVGNTFNSHVKKAHLCYREACNNHVDRKDAALFIMKQLAWGASTNAFGLFCNALITWPARFSVSFILRASSVTLPLNEMGEQLRTSGMSGKVIGELIQNARCEALNRLVDQEF